MLVLIHLQDYWILFPDKITSYLQIKSRNELNILSLPHVKLKTFHRLMHSGLNHYKFYLN